MLRLVVLTLMGFALSMAQPPVISPGPAAGIVLKDRPGLLITNCQTHVQRVFVKLEPRAIYRKQIISTPDLSFAAHMWSENALAQAEGSVTHMLSNLDKFVTTQGELSHPRQKRFLGAMVLAASAIGSLFSLGASSFNAVSLSTVRTQIGELQAELPHLRDLVLTQSGQTKALAETVKGTIVVMNAHSETLNNTIRTLNSLQKVIQVDYAHLQVLTSLMQELLRDIGSSADSLAQGRIPPYLVPMSLVKEILGRASGGAVTDLQAHLAYTLGSSITLHVDAEAREVAFLLSLPVIGLDSIYRLKTVLNVGSWQGDNLVRIDTPEIIAYHDSNPDLYLAPSLQLCKVTKDVHYVCPNKPFVSDFTMGICGLKPMTINSRCRARVTPRYEVHQTFAEVTDGKWMVTTSEREARLTYPKHDTMTRLPLPNSTIYVNVPVDAVVHIGELALYPLPAEFQTEVEVSTFFSQHKFKLDPGVSTQIQARGTQMVSLDPIEEILRAVSTLDQAETPVFTVGWVAADSLLFTIIAGAVLAGGVVTFLGCRRMKRTEYRFDQFLNRIPTGFAGFAGRYRPHDVENPSGRLSQVDPDHYLVDPDVELVVMRDREPPGPGSPIAASRNREY